jgi:outer membrane protein TolC
MPILLFFLLSLTQNLHAKTPPYTPLPQEVKDYFQKLPDKALSIPLVMKGAMKSANSFKRIQAQLPVVDLPISKAQQPFETTVYSQIAIDRNKQESLSPFNSPDQKNKMLTVGIQKYFSSGTQLTAEWQRFSYESPQTTLTTALDHQEAKINLKLAQNLWKDQFGELSRQQLEAASLEREANRYQYAEHFEEWFLGITQLFYQAWMWQTQAKAAYDHVQRRQRLLNISRLKSQRGTAEPQELLQVESHLLTSEVQEAQMRHALTSAWKELVINLKLPEYLLSVDARLIPIIVESSLDDIHNLCENPNKQQLNQSTIHQKLSWQQRAYDLTVNSAQKSFRPTLQLEAQMKTNGIDPSTSKARTESLEGKHPEYILGVSFQWPLQFSQEKSQLQAAVAQSLGTRFAWEQHKDLHRIQWVNQCGDFARLEESRTNLKQMIQKLDRRLVLEEQQFRLGRTSAYQVLQAADDQERGEIELNQVEAALRLQAWNIRRQAGLILQWPKEQGLPFSPLETEKILDSLSQDESKEGKDS